MRSVSVAMTGLAITGLAMTGAALAWTGFTPSPDYQPTICFVSPQPGTTIAIEAMVPDTAVTAGGKALVLTGVLAEDFPLGTDAIAAAAKRIRSAASFARISLGDSVAVLADMRLMRGESADGSMTVAIPLRGEVQGDVTLPDGVTLQDFAPRPIAEMRHDRPRAEVQASVRTLMDYVASQGLKPGPTFIYEFYTDMELADPAAMIEMCVALQ